MESRSCEAAYARFVAGWQKTLVDHVGKSFATPLPSSAVAVKAAAPTTATNVQYRAYGYGPYAYRPYGDYTYPYGGYTYWYPAYPYWDSNTWNTGNGYY